MAGCDESRLESGQSFADPELLKHGSGLTLRGRSGSTMWRTDLRRFE